MAPLATAANGKLGFERKLAGDGSFFLKTYVRTYSGLSPSGTTFEVDQAQLSMEGYPSRGQHLTVFRAYNPWRHISGILAGQVLNDYQLYCEPKRDMPYTGWQAYPSNAPTECDNYEVGIGPLVMLGGHCSFETRFAETGSPVGSICSGVPRTVPANYQAQQWSLLLNTSAGLTKSSQEKLLAYLQEKGYAFLDTEDMMDGLAQRGHTLIVGGAYLSESAANDAQPAVSIPGCSFSTIHNAQQYNWPMTYGMHAVPASAIRTHSAGKFHVTLSLTCSHDASSLKIPILEAYMRLHIYLWPQAEPLSGNRFQASIRFPYSQAEGLPDYSRKGTGMLLVAGSLSANGGTASLESGGEAAAQMRGAATWRWNSSTTVENLGWALSQCSPAPFTWAGAGTLDTLAPDCFYRVSDYEVRYDPSGAAHTYSSGSSEALKLFIFYLYTGQERPNLPSFYVSP